MPLERLEDLALEVAPPIVHAARPLHGPGAEQQPCPPLAPGISGGRGGTAPASLPRQPLALGGRRRNYQLEDKHLSPACIRRHANAPPAQTPIQNGPPR